MWKVFLLFCFKLEGHATQGSSWPCVQGLLTALCSEVSSGSVLSTPPSAQLCAQGSLLVVLWRPLMENPGKMISHTQCQATNHCALSLAPMIVFFQYLPYVLTLILLCRASYVCTCMWYMYLYSFLSPHETHRTILDLQRLESSPSFPRIFSVLPFCV